MEIKDQIINTNNENDKGSKYMEQITSKQLTSLDILANSPIEVDKKFIIEFAKNNSNNLSRESRRLSKILKFTGWNYDEIKDAISSLNESEYPNLFIFIIEIEVSFSIQNLYDNLIKFSKRRPILLQISLLDKKISKLYYKDELSNNFQEIQINSDDLKDFPSFIVSFLSRKIENFENLMIDKLPNLKNSSLILRFLRILKLPEEFFNSIILKCAAYGSKSDLLACLDSSFWSDSEISSIDAHGCLTWTFDDNSTKDEQIQNFEGTENDHASSSSSSLSDINNSLNIEDIDRNTSILHTSVLHFNNEVTNFLISNCTHLIQQLPFNHQIRISTNAFNSKQYDVLSDLLEISDYPFPKNFNKKFKSHQKINQIVKERKMLAKAIKLEDPVGIRMYNECHMDQQFAYNTKNKSALFQAVQAKKYKSLYFLKSFGFKATEFYDLEEVLNDDELKEAKKQSSKQRRKNVDESIKDPDNSVNLLCTRSTIHNRKISREKQTTYRTLIRKWFEDINKITFGPELLNVAASCENLKIIFDFESQSVENVSLQGANAAGSTYPISKWIFIGAKLSDKKREQQIKGVLAHELCHYVMRMVYDNMEYPYYQNMIQIKEMFDAIVKDINKWSSEESEGPDDECNGIISSVFKLYDSKDFHPELIVRVVQILAEFDDDEIKQMYLQDKYKILFEFFRTQILVEIQLFNLKSRNNVRKLNRTADVLECLSSSKLEVISSKNISEIIIKNLIIIITNVPKIMLLDINQYLKEEFGGLYDAQNIFINSKSLKNVEIKRDLENIVADNHKINIFIDCSDEIDFELSNMSSNMFFIVSNEVQQDKLMLSFSKFNQNIEIMKINYAWNDLTVQSKKILLDTTINFQGTDVSLLELLECKFEETEKGLVEIHADLSEIIDSYLLNLLINKSDISINTKNVDKSNFRYMLQPRKFIKNIIQSITDQYPPPLHSEEIKIFSHEELLNDIKTNKYVLISDVAGTGKSWALKFFANILNEQNPTKWVTYVDLKQFIKVFKLQQNSFKFSSFLVDEILKLTKSFEGNFFEKLYKMGKVVIFFDGFDEIAPDCTEFVLKLAESFEYNEGNQLWIATRDHFEINLQEKLRIENSYKFIEFTEEDSVNLIARTWVTLDENENSKINSEVDLETSPKFQNYLQTARQIFKNISIDKGRSIGLPLLSKMIADGLQNNKNDTSDLSKLKIYEKFAQNLFGRWSYKKGDIRKQANISSQSRILNFWRFHQFMAINSMFAEFAKLIFPEHERGLWTDEEIIACGMMKKIGEIFYFLHETFREFFIADFIAKSLNDQRTIQLFAKVLIDSRCKVVRMFLNEALRTCNNLKEISKKLRKVFDKNRDKIENFSEFFTENLDILAEVVIIILKYTDMKNILKKSFITIVNNTENSKLYLKFQEYLFERDYFIFLTHDYDLKKFIIHQNVLHCILRSQLDIEVFDDFLFRVDHKFGIINLLKKELIRQPDNLHVNIFYSICLSPNINAQKFRKFVIMLQQCIARRHIFDLINNCSNDGGNLLQMFVQIGDKVKFKELWTELQSLFQFYKVTKIYNKNFVTQSNNMGDNILHRSLLCNDIEFHKVFWEVLLEFFEHRNELKDFILKINKFGVNFVHSVAISCGSLSIVELIFNILKENFDNAQFQEIIHTKNNCANLFQSATMKPGINLKRFEFFWNIFFNSFDTSKHFLLYLEQEEINAKSIAFSSLSNDIFEFIIEQLRKITTLEDFKNFLKHQMSHKIFLGFIMPDKNLEFCRKILQSYE